MTNATKRIDRAAHALTAYEQDAFPGKPSLLQRDTFYTQALLMALVCDLEHYANHHGINFASAISTGRALNASEVAEDAPYKVGDQVRLTRQHDRCGTVIGWHTDNTDTGTCLLVAVPGIPFIYAESPEYLLPAPEFPSTQTALGTVHHADEAEQLYVTITTRLQDPTESARHALEQDRQRLLAALSTWSGIPQTRLQDELLPRPTTSRYQPAGTRAAATEVSTAINQTPPTPPCGREQQPPPSDPEHTPTT